MAIHGNRLALAHWRRTVAEIYAEVRATGAAEPAVAAARFRAHRDRLFKRHPESPIAVAERSKWQGAARYPYDRAWRVVGEVALDFNYAYNPSCAYENRWSCPLAPVENRLGVAVMAGEQSPVAGEPPA